MNSGTLVGLGLQALRAVALAALLSLAVAGGLGAAGTSPGAGEASESVDEAYGRVAARAGADHRCTFEGVAAPPASALIRTRHGDVRVVSFEQGWDVYNGKRPGSLIAVCLDPATP